MLGANYMATDGNRKNDFFNDFLRSGYMAVNNL